MNSTISIGYFEEKDPKKVETIFNESIQIKQFGFKVKFFSNEIQVIIDPIQEFHRGGVGRDALNGSMIAAGFDLGLGLSLYATELSAKVGSGVARMEIKYKKPVDGNLAIFKCKVLGVKKNLIYTEGFLFDQENQICATAKATLFVKY